MIVSTTSLFVSVSVLNIAGRGTLFQHLIGLILSQSASRALRILCARASDREIIEVRRGSLREGIAIVVTGGRAPFRVLTTQIAGIIGVAIRIGPEHSRSSL